MTLSFDHLLPEGKHAFDYQTVGVGYAAVTRRCFIADEMGLGKTLQALLTLEATDAFPALIVCPASLKGNWVHEIKTWLPNRSVAVLAGRNPYAQIPDEDIVVVNYDILDAWEDGFTAPKALVLDESHYAKNPKAKRTLAAQRLAERVPADGVVLCLTGTPLLNRPVELVSQLRILGRLADVAPRPRRGNDDRAYEFSFKFRYCGPEHNGHGYEFKGATHLDELNDRLRSTCYVRRLRADVLDMNDTRRLPQFLSLNGALATYRQAEADLISFIRVSKGDEAARKARAAEILVGLNTLRLLAGQAKIESACEWVHNFLESNPERSIVIFAQHVEVQKALLKSLAAYAPASILGSQKDVEAQKARFQAKDTRVIVCSLTAAREGHTLTAASDVLFVEQGWTPGGHQQAEDRVNRIGQTAEQVFAYYLLADDTIDNWVYDLIEAKRAVFKAAADGAAVDDEDITAEIIRRLEAKGE